MYSLKRFVCSKCGKELANRHSLSRHKKSCQSAPYVPATSPTYNVPTQPPPPPPPTFVAAAVKESSLEPRPKNPKIQALLDEIVNEDPKRHVPPQAIHKEFSIVPPTTSPSPKNVSTPPSTPTPSSEKMLSSSPKQMLSKPSAEVIATRSPSLNKVLTLSSTPPPPSPRKMLLSPPKQMLPKPSAEVIAAVFPSTPNILSKSTSPPRTKGDIMGYSNDESSEEDSSESEESITSKSSDDNDVDLEVEEFILPDTVEGIRDRFNELYVEFVRKKKHENRNELEFLLDELLRQGALDPTEYTQLNTRLTEAEDLTTDKEEKEEEEEDEEEENMTNAAIQYLILHDKEELQDLMEEIKDEIDAEFIDIVLDIEKLLEEFFVKEFVDGETIRSQINALLNQLESSKIPKSKQHRIKMLVDDIEKNRYRVEQIFQRLMDAEDKEEMLTVLKTLVREGHLSDEQFEQLAELEDPDLHTIKEVITNTKVGEGLKFLPRTISNLRHTLQSLLTELKESGSALLKSKITAIMEELLRRNAIRVGEYENLKELTV